MKVGVFMKVKVIPVGMRLIKTGVSLFICLVAAQVIGLPIPIYACVAAIFSMKGTMGESFHYGISRMVSTIVGGALALAVLFCGIHKIAPYIEILAVTIGVILNLYFCVLIKAPDAAGLSSVIFLTIVLQHPVDYVRFTIIRVIETLAGILISIIVNSFGIERMKKLLHMKQKKAACPEL